MRVNSIAVDVSKDTSGKESVEDIKKKFQKAKFGENPGIHAMQWLGEGRLGNVQWVGDDFDL